MKKLAFIIGLILIMSVGCNKENPQPEIPIDIPIVEYKYYIEDGSKAFYFNQELYIGQQFLYINDDGIPLFESNSTMYLSDSKIIRFLVGRDTTYFKFYVFDSEKPRILNIYVGDDTTHALTLNFPNVKNYAAVLFDKETVKEIEVW